MSEQKTKQKQVTDPSLIEGVMAAIEAETARKAAGFKNAEIHIRREGTQIVLPSDPREMSIDEAIESLARKKEAEEKEVSVHEEIHAFPLDGAHAFMLALKEIYGWASPEARQSFFGPVPPTTVNLEIDYGVYTQVIWGDFKVPGLSGVLRTGASFENGKPCFVIGGKVKKKHQKEVAEIAALTRKLVKEQSVYRGKAIRLQTDSDGEIQWSQGPAFLDLSGVNPNELTFSEEVADQVKTNLFTPIEYTDICREHKIPLKRGVLLEGPFGTGKTLTAFVTALKAREKGWTFILVDRVSGLKDALTFARLYQPAVVFAEDIDRAISGDDRTVKIDDILNTIDGAEAKGSEVITILTTNDVKGINRAMLRPGRLDAIISVQAPDAKAAEKLIRIYSRGLILENESLDDAGKELEGQIPATIREAVERAKLYAIGHTAKGTRLSLRCSDIVLAAKGMKMHLQLLNGIKTFEPSVNERVGMAFADLIAEQIKTDVPSSETGVEVKATKKAVEKIQARLM